MLYSRTLLFLRNGFLPGLFHNQQYGICWCKRGEYGYLTDNQHALLHPLIIIHLRLLFWWNLQIRWHPAHQTTFSSYYCQDSLRVRLTSRGNRSSSLLPGMFFPEPLFIFSLSSTPSRGLYSPPFRLNSQATSSKKPLAACLLATPQWVKCPSGFSPLLCLPLL